MTESNLSKTSRQRVYIRLGSLATRPASRCGPAARRIVQANGEGLTTVRASLETKHNMPKPQGPNQVQTIARSSQEDRHVVLQQPDTGEGGLRGRVYDKGPGELTPRQRCRIQ